jgi:hypothetical protein
MKRIVLFIVWFVIFCSFVPPVFADEEALLWTPVSVAGSGGTHVAAEDGVYTLLGNPALLNSVTQSMYFAVSGGIEDVYQNGKMGTTIPPAYYTVAGPLALGVVSKGVGYGIFNYLRFHENGMDIHLIGSAGIDWVLINKAIVKLDFGLSPRFSFSLRQSNATIIAAASVTPGLLCSFANRFSLGISYADVVSVANLTTRIGSEFTQISSSLNTGIAADIVSNAILGLTLFADCRDIVGFFDGDTEDPLQQLGCGIRAKFRNFFWLSLGMFELAPTVGLGLNLGAIKVEAAFFTNGITMGIKMVRD